MQRSLTSRSSVLWLLRSPWTLTAAAGLVGIAIVWDGAGAKAVSGIGGLLWVACAVALASELRRDRRLLTTGVLAVGLAVFFALVVRPSDGLIAVLAFGSGGALLAYVARAMELTWSVLLPAIWLPVHLAVAVSKAAYQAMTDGEVAVRSDPPPTTAAVPMLMVLAAWGGGWLVLRWLKRRRGPIGAVVSRA